MFDEGISTTGDLIDLGVEAGAVNKSGAWYNFGDIRLGQGRENAKKFIKENPELMDEIKQLILIDKGLIKEISEEEQEEHREVQEAEIPVEVEA